MGKQKEQAVDEKKSILAVRAKHDTMLMLKLANEEVGKLNNVFTLVSLIGPIVISFLYLFLAIDFSALVWWHLVVDVAATLALIIALFVLVYKLDIAQRVITLIEICKVDRQNRIKALEKKLSY